ncbi:PTS fructose transporter subunit IIB [Halapricum hydrolyticum]|uniref:Fructose PTS transporter subunit IIB n=1 Tax=Halapricum hydrolyticum TaxID=2979991 RepID=A0AAE3IDC5_9EURY|nr:PTS fructose transporter subunit IIB [Halapricum hydrolyticum]MCU4718931.1 fructose PTS transporter subunit IIB [Halapricum hydrolyticum]MCU4727976.1 fructose PTS transporter subunit IIB [Halapricum hydrolyticum]
MKFVAVTSCPTGIAHSQMGAEGLEQAAESLGHEITVEIQGAMGAENELTGEDIAEADAVIIAADTSVSRDRFEGKPVVKAPVADAINEAEDLLQQAAEKAEGDTAETTSEEGETTESEAATIEPEKETSAEADADTESEPPASSDRSESTGLLGKIKQLFS